MVTCLFILLLLIVSPFGAVTSASDTPTPTPTPSNTPTPTPTPSNTPTPTPSQTPSNTPTPTPTPVPVPVPAPAPAPAPAVPDYIWNTLQPKTKGPTTNRAYFSFALSPDDNTLLVLGGSTDKQNWKYQLNTSDWIASEEKLSLTGQCTTQGPDAKHVYIFGGKSMTDGLADGAILRNYSWEWDNISDMTPPAPAKHLLDAACVYAAERFYVFGGSTTDPSVCTSDLIFYNMTSMTWQNATMEKGPSARSGSNLISYMDANNTEWLVLFGGSCNGQPIFDNHVWWFNVSGGNWLSTPGGFALNSMSVVKKDAETVLVFGGKNDKGEPQNGFFFYNLTSQEYMTVEIMDTPAPRFGQSVTYARRRMIVFGGQTQQQEAADVLYQFVMEKDCKADNATCGVCVLAGCGWCGAIEGSTAGETCVAGNSYGQYVPGTCKEQFTVEAMECRITPTIPKWLVPVLVVALILIFALVVATYIVDWRMGNTRSRGYEVVS